MNEALPAAMVNGYEDQIPVVNLPDPNDRHVIAAGITAGASLILTWNLRHFPAKELKKFGLRKETPDTFLAALYNEVPDLIVGTLANARRNLTETRVSALEFIDFSEAKDPPGLRSRRRSTLPICSKKDRHKLNLS